MILNRIEAKPGQVWKTAKGHRVRVLAGGDANIVETAYIDGRVNGYLGANFYADNGRAVRDADQLLEREK